jgi:hypothetical protein
MGLFEQQYTHMGLFEQQYTHMESRKATAAGKKIVKFCTTCNTLIFEEEDGSLVDGCWTTRQCW